MKAYRNHFGVSWQCAFIELEMLGIEIDPEYKQQVLQTVAAQAEAKKRKKAEREATLAEEIGLYQDEHFAFIAGYTSWGFPYGVTWEEMEQIEHGEDEELMTEEEYSCYHAKKLSIKDT